MNRIEGAIMRTPKPRPLAIALGMALGTLLPMAGAQAGLVEDMASCVKNTGKAALSTVSVATDLAALTADPIGAICIAKVAMPDPITVVGAGVVQGLNIAGTAKKGSCNNDLMNAALEPLVSGVSSLTGLSLDKTPLKEAASQGKQALWDTFTTTPPVDVVMGGIGCGCRFVDAGVSVETVKELYTAYTAAGESCSKVITALADAACDAVKSGQGQANEYSKSAGEAYAAASDASCKVIDAMAKTLKAVTDPLGTAEELYNGAFEEGLFKAVQDKPETPQQHYQRVWQPMEQPYIARSIEIGKPVPADGHFHGPNGGPWKVKDTWQFTKDYYDSRGMSGPNAQKVADALRDRWDETVFPQIDMGLHRKAFDKEAKSHRDKRSKGIDFGKLGGYSAEIDALFKQYPEGAWLAWQANSGLDRKKFTAFLDIAYNQTVQAELDRLAKIMATQLAAVPSAILETDALIDGLPQAVAAEVEKPCAGLQQQINAACKAAAKSAVAKADKERDTRRIKIYSPVGGDYGKKDDKGHYRNFAPRYLHKDAPDLNFSGWATTSQGVIKGVNEAAEKYWGTMAWFKSAKEIADLRDKLVKEGLAKTGRYSDAQATFDQWYPYWRSRCGDAVGQPGAAPTPVCEQKLAPAIAQCALDRMEKGTALGLAKDVAQAAVPGPGGAGNASPGAINPNTAQAPQASQNPSLFGVPPALAGAGGFAPGNLIASQPVGPAGQPGKPAANPALASGATPSTQVGSAKKPAATDHSGVGLAGLDLGLPCGDYAQKAFNELGILAATGKLAGLAAAQDQETRKIANVLKASFIGEAGRPGTSGARGAEGQRPDRELGKGSDKGRSDSVRMPADTRPGARDLTSRDGGLRLNGGLENPDVGRAGRPGAALSLPGGLDVAGDRGAPNPASELGRGRGLALPPPAVAPDPRQPAGEGRSSLPVDGVRGGGLALPPPPGAPPSGPRPGLLMPPAPLPSPRDPTGDARLPAPPDSGRGGGSSPPAPPGTQPVNPRPGLPLPPAPPPDPRSGLATPGAAMTPAPPLARPMPGEIRPPTAAESVRGGVAPSDPREPVVPTDPRTTAVEEGSGWTAPRAAPPPAPMRR